MNSGVKALDLLREGNRRFSSDNPSIESQIHQTQLKRLVQHQEPFAIILGCSDSRVPVEIIFDQGLGALFVIRVPGNIVAPSILGSVEFAVERFDIRLLVVLGHSRCGAVDAMLKILQHPEEKLSPNIRSLVQSIRSGVEPLVSSDLKNDPENLIHEAVRANIRTSVKMLKKGSPLLQKLVEESGLMVIGAEYSLETGIVEFFDGVPVGH